MTTDFDAIAIEHLALTNENEAIGPILVGSSENEIAWQPFLATHRTSSAVNRGFQIGGSARGITRPGYVPRLYAALL